MRLSLLLPVLAGLAAAQTDTTTATVAIDTTTATVASDTGSAISTGSIVTLSSLITLSSSETAVTSTATVVSATTETVVTPTLVTPTLSTSLSLSLSSLGPLTVDRRLTMDNSTLYYSQEPQFHVYCHGYRRCNRRGQCAGAGYGTRCGVCFGCGPALRTFEKDGEAD